VLIGQAGVDKARHSVTGFVKSPDAFYIAYNAAGAIEINTGKARRFAWAIALAFLSVCKVQMAIAGAKDGQGAISR
jgi:hypothetical protein